MKCVSQIPVTLRTYGAQVERSGVTDENYDGKLLSLLIAAGINMLTIYAEFEGISRSALFAKYLNLGEEEQICFVPLGSLLSPRDQIHYWVICSSLVLVRKGGVCQPIRVMHR